MRIEGQGRMGIMGASPHTPYWEWEKGAELCGGRKWGGDWFSGNSAPDGAGKRDMQKHAPPGNPTPSAACGAGGFHILIIRPSPFLNMGQSPIPHYFIIVGKCEKRVLMTNTTQGSICSLTIRLSAPRAGLTSSTSPSFGLGRHRGQARHAKTRAPWQSNPQRRVRG